MAGPVVLLDVDGPLADFTGAYLDALYAVTGKRHSAEEVDRWAIWACPFFERAAHSFGATVASLRRAVDARVCEPGFCAGLRVQPGAREAVEEIADVANVYAVTSPWDSSRTWMFERLHWVAEHFDIPRERVIQTAAKHLVRGEVFVDDRAAHVLAWRDAWPDGAAFLFDMPHNIGDGLDGYRGGWPRVIAEVTRRMS